jgi:lipopolysaccharide biosynthesis glycosyltransferase
MLDVEFVDIARRLPEDLPISGELERFTYARYLIPEILVGEASRVIYLDCDVLVLADPSGLQSVELGGLVGAAVRDFDTPTVSSPYGLKDWRHLRLDPLTPYFNAGVLVIDPGAWQEEKISEQTFAYALTSSSQLRCADQDAFNAVVRGRLKQLPLRWNAQPPVRKKEPLLYAFVAAEDVDDAFREPSIVHFSESVKPWDAGSNDPMSPRWRAAARRAGWGHGRPTLSAYVKCWRRRLKASARAVLHG